MIIKVIQNKQLSDFEFCPIWECEPSKFNWEYKEEEHCFIIDGKDTISGSHNTLNIER